MSELTYYDQVQQTAGFLRARWDRVPDAAVVLGSGLGDFADGLQDAMVLPYGEVPNWPQSRVVGHQGKLSMGTASGKFIAALSGRVHYYEGYDLRTVTFPVRVLAALGIKVLILTNAAGGINTRFAAGDLMAIDDHINLMGSSPLMGSNDERFGVRFPDMSAVYSPRVRRLADQAAAALQLTLQHGIYAGCHGPSYETPAEIRYLRLIGADAVGMSTVPEAIVARHMQMEVFGVSCITNLAAGVLPDPLNHDEVLETARRVRGGFIALLNAIIAGL